MTTTTTDQTGFELLIAQKIESDPAWAKRYLRTRSRLRTTERVLGAIDRRRLQLKMSKADLARKIGAQPADVRRIFSRQAANPTIGRLADMADALGLELEVKAASDR